MKTIRAVFSRENSREPSKALRLLGNAILRSLWERPLPPGGIPTLLSRIEKERRDNPHRLETGGTE